jgi:hypothetical protein
MVYGLECPVMSRFSRRLGNCGARLSRRAIVHLAVLDILCFAVVRKRSIISHTICQFLYILNMLCDTFLGRCIVNIYNMLSLFFPEKASYGV